MTRSNRVLGCMALGAFALLFSAGLLLDSKPYLDELRRPAPATEGDATKQAQQTSQTALSTSGLPTVAGGPRLASFSDWLPLQQVIEPFQRLYGSRVGTFLSAMLLYAPTNALLLTLLAGFLGGCASNITYESAKERSGADADAAAVAEAAKAPAGPVSAGAAKDNPYVRESPFASMIRSLVVYLVFMAGMFITAGDPFPAPKIDPKAPDEITQAEQNARSNQYVRFAATISTFAFAVGYDPRRLAELLRGLPGAK